MQEEETQENIRQLYDEYSKRFESIEYKADISACGFRIIEDQIFPIEMKEYGEVNVIPAFEQEYNRLALFLLWKTERLCTKRTSWRRTTGTGADEAVYKRDCGGVLSGFEPG